jgi:hypothetical protein
MSNAANLALDGGDPRMPQHEEGFEPMTAARHHLINDPNVSFEEYLHYASITRAEEMAHFQATPKEKRTIASTIKGRFRHTSSAPAPVTPPEATEADEKTGSTTGEKNAADPNSNVPTELRHYDHPSQVSDAEWKTLSRGIRTASWSTCFFLITTDILGPFSTPWSFAQMGYGPGIALYTTFGLLATL